MQRWPARCWRWRRWGKAGKVLTIHPMGLGLLLLHGRTYTLRAILLVSFVNLCGDVFRQRRHVNVIRWLAPAVALPDSKQ